MALHDNRFNHPLLDELDELETLLYRAGQSTAGDPDPATRDELERWEPGEFTHHVTQEEIDAAGHLLFAASGLVSAAVKILTRDLVQGRNNNETGV